MNPYRYLFEIFAHGVWLAGRAYAAYRTLTHATYAQEW